ncbi:MAG: spore germination protein [Oscillospiraceae bacterium]|nr:spore germination protein [Oscillospiraceae bacterium]
MNIQGENALPEAKIFKKIFSDCEDFFSRELCLGTVRGELFWIEGLVSGVDLAETVLRPLAENPALRRGDAAACAEAILAGAVYNVTVRRRERLEELQSDLLNGYAVLILPGAWLSFDSRSPIHRSISEPKLDKGILGPKEAFTETLRINSALLRRRLKTPELKNRELNVGRRSATRVSILWLEGIARTESVEALTAALGAIDIDGVTALGDIAGYVAPRRRGMFPQFLCTERPDRLARLLLQGRVAILIDGIPQALVLPCTLPELMRVSEDRSVHAAAASAVLLLRWGALLTSLLLPALYVAVAMYHQEMIPYRLLESIIESKQNVPFSTGAEILGMLAAFSLLQEAGLRLPEQAGTTVSIIGTLIVGQSAVEARVVSPIAVIVVAFAGIAGYTAPNQQLGAAMRLWRFGLAVSTLFLGLYGLMAGLVLLLWRLCSMECWGTAYLYPLADGEGGRLRAALLRMPLRLQKYRDRPLWGRNRRRQA